MKTTIPFRMLISLLPASCGCWDTNASLSNEAVNACPVWISPSETRLGSSVDISDWTVKKLESLCDEWASLGFDKFVVSFQSHSFEFQRGIISEHVAPLENVPVECFVFTSKGVSNVSCRFETNSWRKHPSLPFDGSDVGISVQCVVERSLRMPTFVKAMTDTLNKHSGYSFIAFGDNSLSLDDIPGVLSEGRQLRWNPAKERQWPNDLGHEEMSPEQ